MSLEGQTILLIGYSEWGFWRSAHDWAYQLAKNNTVIFVEGFPRYPIWKRGRRMAYWRRFLSQPVRRISERLVLVSPPPMLPFAVPLVSKMWPDAIARRSIELSKALHVRCLRSILRRLGLSPNLYICHEPFDLLMAGAFGEMASVYLTYDEVSLYWVNATAGSVIDELEREHIGRADLVLASSPPQYEKRKALNSNTHFLPHGVDFDLYHRALACDLPLPPDMAEIPRPRIGFVGVLDKRMDLRLVAEVAKARPDWSLVLVGPTWESLQPHPLSAGLPGNVHLLGEKGVREVPAYLRHFDVAIIPYQVTAATNTMFPIKILEYLAAGKPVVSTGLASIEGMREALRIAGSGQEFVAAIEEELATDSPEKVQARVSLARESDWSVRAKRLGDLVEEKLK